MGEAEKESGMPEIDEQQLIRRRWAGGKPFAVYFYTPWCGTCRLGGRMLDIVRTIEPEAAIWKADVNYMPAVVQEWKIESVPCLAFIEDKRISEKLYTMQSVPFLLETVRRRLIQSLGEGIE